MTYRPIPRELIAATAEARERATARWEKDIRPTMQPPPARQKATARSAEVQRADPLPPLSDEAKRRVFSLIRELRQRRMNETW